MKLFSVERRVAADRARLIGDVARADGARFELEFSYEAVHAPLLSDCADAFVPALLLPAMAAGEALEIVPPVSPLLLGHLSRLQAIFSAWFPHYASVEVSASPRSGAEPARAAGVGAFFSGGVDAFYTLLKSLRGLPGEAPPITHLIYFHGLETTLDARRGADASEKRARDVAQEAGLVCVAGETNLRSHFPLLWGEYCGAGLAAAAHSLASGLGHVLVPSTDSYADAPPWGSHPLVDELWSTERTLVLADGAEARRVDKLVRLVAGDPLARRHLRVCTQNAGGDFNCGCCAKCVRTMITLRALGLEARFDTLPPELPTPLGPALAADYTMYLEQNLELLEQRGRAPDLARQVRRALRSRRRRSALRTWLENSAFAPALPWLRALRARNR